MPSPSYVKTETRDAIATVTIDRRERLNALNPDVIDGLEAAFEDLRRDDSLRGVVLTGAGGKAFVAGADIGELARMTPRTGTAVSERGQAVLRAIETFPRPVVAAVGGYALGGGCELALACHLRVASDRAQFGLPEVGLGIVPGYGGTVRLARLVGLGRALEMVLTGDSVGAERALAIGLANMVVPHDELLERARAYVGKIARKGPVAVEMALKSVYGALECSTPAALRFEAAAFGLLASTDDMREGMSAFLEKRKPQFQGR